jgi:pimeloyl-ACP methyl ester carboxylesterase
MSPRQGWEDWVQLGRDRLRVLVRGEGTPVLLINGLGASLPMWRPLLEDLQGLEVVAFDAPGTGQSSTPRLPYRVGHMVRLVARLLDRLGYDEVDVVGYSLGGVVAQQLAHEAPARVRRMVLAATLCGWGGHPAPLSAYLAVGTPIRYYWRRAYEVSMPLLGHSSREADPGFIERTAATRLASPPSVAGYFLQFAAGWGWSSLRWLPMVQQPTLVISGTADRLVPLPNAYLLAARLPNARLSLFEDWGHLLLMDGSSGAGRTIGEFLRADPLHQSPTWRAAVEVTDADHVASMRAAVGKLDLANLYTRMWRSVFAPSSR